MWKSLLSLFISGTLQAADASPATLHVCLEDKPVFHLYDRPGQENAANPGIVIDFLKLVTQKFAVKLEIVRRPTTACRVLMKAGTVDAYGIISHIPEREEWAVYPRLPNGQLDSSRLFTRAGYFLYSLQDKILPWDGRNLAALKGLRIGSNEGYMINDELKKAGVQVETFKSSDAMYTRLKDKQLDGFTLHSNRIDKKILQLGLRKYEIPLRMNDYYLTFSKAFYQNSKAFCEKVWKESYQFEQSPDGKKAMERYESLIDFPSR